MLMFEKAVCYIEAATSLTVIERYGQRAAYKILSTHLNSREVFDFNPSGGDAIKPARKVSEKYLSLQSLREKHEDEWITERMYPAACLSEEESHKLQEADVTNNSSNKANAQLIETSYGVFSYAQLYKLFLYLSSAAVQFEMPHRVIMRKRVRELFKLNSDEQPNKEKIDNTMIFLEHAASEPNGLPAQLLKNICFCRWRASELSRIQTHRVSDSQSRLRVEAQKNFEDVVRFLAEQQNFYI